MSSATSSTPGSRLSSAVISDRQGTSLFPLSLTPFEEYMLLDDRPAYPSIGCAALRLTGRFDRPAFQSALDATLTRHPLLCALVRRTGRGRFEWIDSQRIRPAIHWDQDEPWAPLVQIDLQREVGLRIHVHESGDQTRMLMQLHHACCDGLGYMGFINDLLSTYHETFSPGLTLSRALPAPERLRFRGKYGMTPARWLARIPKDLVASLAAIEYFSHRPVALAPNGVPTSQGATVPTPLLVWQTLNEAETLGLRQAARKLGSSVNDLLLTAGFFAVNQWNERYDPQGSQGVVRIAIPVSLRGPEDEVMPAANVVSMLYLDRRPHRYASLPSLLRSVRREMGFCKKWRLGLTMIHFIRAFRALPGGLSRMLPEDRSLATAVLSNLGNITHFLAVPRLDDGRPVAGNVILDGWSPMPPLRPGTHVSIGVYSDAGRMTVSANCDPQRFSPEGAQELLATFLGQVAALCAESRQLAGSGGMDAFPPEG